MGLKLDQLRKALSELHPSGQRGLEGLVRDLLEALTGRRFYLAKSGAQHGRDMSTGGSGDTWIAVESKRIGSSSSPRATEMLGYLTSSILDIPGLDLWVVATTAEIPDQSATALEKCGRANGVGVRILDWAAGGMPRLAVLCANAPGLVLTFLKDQEQPGSDLESVSAELDAFPESEGFDNVLAGIVNEFSSSSLGYDHARQASVTYLMNHMTSPREAKAEFSQLLDLLNPDALVVPRKGVHDCLDRWWNQWPERPNPAVVLGGEGFGKTWATLSWWLGLANSAPLTLFIPSGRDICSDPAVLLAAELARHVGFDDERYWKRRQAGWLQRPSTSAPVFLVIIDGINERKDINWRKLFHAFQAEPWRGRIAVIATCRSRFWKTKLGALSSLEDQPFVCTVNGFNDDELGEALRQCELLVHDLPCKLREALRKPRIFRIARRHLVDSNSVAAVSVDRLFFEDWKDRFEGKPGRLNLTPERFSRALVEIARDHRGGMTQFSTRQLVRRLATDEISAESFVEDLDELIDGGLFESNKAGSSDYRISTRLLPHALGHLLVSEVSDASDGERDLPEEVIADYLELYDGTEVANSIRRSAALISALIGDFPFAGRMALWREWLLGHNLSDEDRIAFCGFAAEHPRLYLDLAEGFRRDWTRNHSAGQLLAAAMAQASHLGANHQVLSERFEKWLGMTNPRGFSFQRGADGENTTKIEAQIQQNLKKAGDVGDCVVHGFRLSMVEDDTFRWLAGIALRVISKNPARVFAGAFVNWALSRAVMGVAEEFDEVSWILRLGAGLEDDLWLDLKWRVENLSKVSDSVGLKAAAFLLRAHGSKQAHELLNRLPEAITSPPSWYQEATADPCNRIVEWKPENVRDCLGRSDLDVVLKIRKLKSRALDPTLKPPPEFIQELGQLPVLGDVSSLRSCRSTTRADLDYDDAEPTLAAFSPTTLSSFIRSLVVGLPERNKEARLMLAFEIAEFFALLEEAEYKAMEACRGAISVKTGQLDRDDRAAEAHLSKVLLAGQGAADQVEFLLSRDKAASDYSDFKPIFKQLGPAAPVQMLSKASHDAPLHECRRVLWFLSSQDMVLAAQDRENLLELARHSDSLVRALALEILLNTDDSQIGQSFVETDWRWIDDNNHEQESWWGSLCLATYGISIPFGELRTRALPALLGYAVGQRGNRVREIREFAKTIDHVWVDIQASADQHDTPGVRLVVERGSRSAIDRSIPRVVSVDEARDLGLTAREYYWEESLGQRISRAFQAADATEWAKGQEELRSQFEMALQQQRQSGSLWLSQEFRSEGLRKVVTSEMALAEKWVNTAVSEEGRVIDPGLLFKASAFYQRLCAILLDVAPSAGGRLWTALDSADLFTGIRGRRTGLDYRIMMLFECAENPTVCRLRQRVFDRCTNDHEIFDVVLAGIAGGTALWLANALAADLESDALWRNARALTVAGFFDDNDAASSALEQHSTFGDDWLAKVAQGAHSRYQRNLWAKHWYRKFLCCDEREGAFAAFRLFLRCVDRRYWLWDQDDLEKDTGSHQWKQQHLRLNEGVISKSAARNEKDAERNLYLTRTAVGKVWPWIEDSMVH